MLSKASEILLHTNCKKFAIITVSDHVKLKAAQPFVYLEILVIQNVFMLDLIITEKKMSTVVEKYIEYWPLKGSSVEDVITYAKQVGEHYGYQYDVETASFHDVIPSVAESIQ